MRPASDDDQVVVLLVSLLGLRNDALSEIYPGQPTRLAS